MEPVLNDAGPLDQAISVRPRRWAPFCRDVFKVLSIGSSLQRAALTSATNYHFTPQGGLLPSAEYCQCVSLFNDIKQSPTRCHDRDLD